MKNWTCCCAVLMLGVATGLLAQTSTPLQFSGVIHDYSPATTVMPMGPWEMRGSWTLTLDGTGKGDFSAALTMELSDYTRNSSNVDATFGRGLPYAAHAPHHHPGGQRRASCYGRLRTDRPGEHHERWEPSALRGVYIVGYRQRRKDRGVLERHAAISRRCAGSFWVAVDPRRG